MLQAWGIEYSEVLVRWKYTSVLWGFEPRIDYTSNVKARLQPWCTSGRYFRSVTPSLVVCTRQVRVQRRHAHAHNTLARANTQSLTVFVTQAHVYTHTCSHDHTPHARTHTHAYACTRTHARAPAQSCTRIQVKKQVTNVKSTLHVSYLCVLHENSILKVHIAIVKQCTK